MSITTDVCHWTHDDLDMGTWATDCNQTFCLIDGTPDDNELKYCCYCGKPLVSMPYQYPEDEE